METGVLYTYSKYEADALMDTEIMQHTDENYRSEIGNANLGRRQLLTNKKKNTIPFSIKNGIG